MSAFVQNALAGLQELATRYNFKGYQAPPDNPGGMPQVAQDRFTRTPIFFTGTDPNLAHYLPNTNAQDQLYNSTNASNLNKDDVIKLDNLAKSWKNINDIVQSNPSNFGTNGNTIAHEVAHRIYNNANLAPIANQLLPSVPLDTKLLIRDSPTYNTMAKPYAGSAEQFTDEGLGYSMGRNPSQDDLDYVNTVASKIKDPKLRDTLLKMVTSVSKNKDIR